MDVFSAVGFLSAAALPYVHPAVLAEYVHVVQGLILFVVIGRLIFLFIKPRLGSSSSHGHRGTKSKVKLLDDDKIADIVDNWTPEPLAPRLTPSQERDAANEVIISSTTRTHVTANGKENVLHLARSSYLGMIGHPKLQDIAEKALRKYGCGSCGPRGFYGTLDVHLLVEQKITKFLGGDESILFPSGFATVSSVISCFAKPGDILIVDEGVSHAVQVGVTLSRAKVHFFKHNDTTDLERILTQTMPKKGEKIVRKFVIIEGLYYNYGDVAPLPEILELKSKYLFRIVLDESHSIGVLGKSGRGITEHFAVDIKQIELLTGSLSNAVGSGGGFCLAEKTLVYHQRINASGYVFSASLPPYLSACTLGVFDMLESDPSIVPTLKRNTQRLHAGLKKINGLAVTSDAISPAIHVALAKSSGNREEDEDKLQAIVNKALDNGVLLTRAKYVEAERFRPPPSIRVCASSAFSDEDIDQALKGIQKAANVVLRG